MSESTETKRYYPPFQLRILLAPVGLALLIGLPLLMKPGKGAAGIGLMLVAFLSTLQTWRWALRVDISARLICGRNPQTLKLTQLELATIAAAREIEFSIGRIKGWALANDRGDEVFVNEAALQDPRIRPFIEREKGRV